MLTSYFLLNLQTSQFSLVSGRPKVRTGSLKSSMTCNNISLILNSLYIIVFNITQQNSSTCGETLKTKHNPLILVVTKKNILSLLYRNPFQVVIQL